MFHGVQFYDQHGDLCRVVAEFAANGLLLGHPVLIVATPQHRAGIESRLVARGFHLPMLARTRQLTLLDAEHALANLMPEGRLDETRFRRMLAPLVEQIEEAGAELHAYGEMVDVLWKRGEPQAALLLEARWNAVLENHHVRLLCGYDRGNRYISHDVEDICSHHSHVISETGNAAAAV